MAGREDRRASLIGGRAGGAREARQTIGEYFRLFQIERMSCAFNRVHWRIRPRLGHCERTGGRSDHVMIAIDELHRHRYSQLLEVTVGIGAGQ